MTKVHHVVLTLSVSALLLWQLIELVDRERLLLHMRNTIVDTIITNFNEDKLSTNTVHDRKYGYFLQITDTHVILFKAFYKKWHSVLIFLIKFNR